VPDPAQESKCSQEQLRFMISNAKNHASIFRPFFRNKATKSLFLRLRGNDRW
jgi:hypothetical protein